MKNYEKPLLILEDIDLDCILSVSMVNESAGTPGNGDFDETWN